VVGVVDSVEVAVVVAVVTTMAITRVVMAMVMVHLQLMVVVMITLGMDREDMTILDMEVVMITLEVTIRVDMLPMVMEIMESSRTSEGRARHHVAGEEGGEQLHINTSVGCLL